MTDGMSEEVDMTSTCVECGMDRPWDTEHFPVPFEDTCCWCLMDATDGWQP